MASTVVSKKLVSSDAGIAGGTLNQGPKVYIGRRTGAVIEINARRDSLGFERIEDYFPDSDSEEEENKSRNAKPIKLKPNQYIGRRTGALIEINARKDRHGFELIEDYFPDSIRESDISTASNKVLKSNSKVSTSILENSSASTENNRQESDTENNENVLEPTNTSHAKSPWVENKDTFTPKEKEADISPNLTGTAVKNRAVSSEPSPQFLGSKKRLFCSSNIMDITREKIDETEEEIDIVGVSDDEEEEPNVHNQQGMKSILSKSAHKEIEDPKTTIGNDTLDTLIVDVDDSESLCVTFANKSKSSNFEDDDDSKVGKAALKEKGIDDTLIVDIEDDSTFVTLGDNSKELKVAGTTSLRNDHLVVDDEAIYQMDESIVLEGTKHKAISPEFGEISKPASRNSGEEVDRTEDVVKPNGRKTRNYNKLTDGDRSLQPGMKRATRKSKKSVSRKILKGQPQDEDDSANDAESDMSINQNIDGDTSLKAGSKKVTKHSKKAVSRNSLKEQPQDEDDSENDAESDMSIKQNIYGDTSLQPGLKKATKQSKKSVSRNSLKEQPQDEDKSENDAESAMSINQNIDGDTSLQPGLKKATKKSNKSVYRNSLKEQPQDEDDSENDAESDMSIKQNIDGDASLKVGSKKVTKNSKKSISRKSLKEQPQDEDDSENDAESDMSIIQKIDGDTSLQPGMKKATGKSKKSVSRNSLKEPPQDEDDSDDDAESAMSINQNIDDDTSLQPGMKKATKNSKKSVSRKSLKKQPQNEDDSKNDAESAMSIIQKIDGDRSLQPGMKKATGKSKKSVSRNSLKEPPQDEDDSDDNAESAMSINQIIDDDTSLQPGMKKATKNSKKSVSRNSLKEQPNTSNKSVSRKSIKEPKENQEVVVDVSVNLSNLNQTNKSFKPVKKATRKSKKSFSNKNTKEKREEDDTEVNEETIEKQKTEDESFKKKATRKSTKTWETETEDYDTAVCDTQEGGGCEDTLKECTRKTRITRNKIQAHKHSQSKTDELQEPDVNNIKVDDEQESQTIGRKPGKNNRKTKGKKSENKGTAWRTMLMNHGGDDDDDSHNDEDDDDKKDDEDQSTENNVKIKNGKRISPGSKSSPSDSEAVPEKKKLRKSKPKPKSKLLMKTRRKPVTNTTRNDVTDCVGMADEHDDDDAATTKNSSPNEMALGSETAAEPQNKSSRKRTNLTRFQSMHIPDSSTPILNGSSYVLPPSSVKSILKSNASRTQSADKKKRRVSIATNKKSLTPCSATDDDDGDSKQDKSGRRRKSSVNFAPTPSFHISPDDLTLEDSFDKLPKLSFVTNYSGVSSEDNTFTPGECSTTTFASSVSSLASNSDSEDDSKCYNESQEITIGSAKRKQIAEDAEERDDSSVRRSKRTKIPPLKYWKNEKIVYVRRPSGSYVSGINKVPTPKVPKRKLSKKPKQKKKIEIRNESCGEEAQDFNDVPADMEEVAYSAIPVVNSHTGQPVHLDLVHSPAMLSFVNTSSKPAKPDDPLIIDKYMSHNQFGAGQLILRPGAEKGKQQVLADTMIFYVLKGRIEVTLHETTLCLPAGSTFFVPTGNWYNLKNVERLEAKLFFVQIKGC